MPIPRFSSEPQVHAEQSKHKAQIFLHFLSHQTKDQTHFNQNHQTIANRASQFTKKEKRKTLTPRQQNPNEPMPENPNQPNPSASIEYSVNCLMLISGVFSNSGGSSPGRV